MRNSTKLVMLGLLLVPFAAVINLVDAYAETFNVEIEEGSAAPGCEVENKCYEPATITVPVGSTVVWTNKDAAGHTVTSGNPGDTDAGSLFDSTKDPSGFLIKAEATWQYTFNKKGEFPYFCQVHPYMVAKVIVGGEAPPPPPTRPEGGLVLTTDNGSIDVEVTVDNAMVEDGMVRVDPPQEVTFHIKFIDPTTGQTLEHVNYEYHTADQTGAMPVQKTNIHVHDGTDSQSVAFANTGSFTLTIEVLGTGIDRPFDTKYSGIAISRVTVTPEFPLSVMAIMAAVVGIGIAATRFRNTLKL